MKKLASLFIALFSLVWLTGAGWLPLATSAGGGCSQATTFLARTSGLSGTETTVYTNLICGLVTDGIITGTMAGSGSGASACGSIFDAFYLLATNTTTTASLNLCSTSFSLTSTGGLTFTADQGYTGDGTNNLLTSLVPNAGGLNYAQDSASIGACDLTNRTTSDATTIIGSRNGAGTSYSYISPNFTGNTYAPELNGFTFGTTGAASTAQGINAVSRTSSANIAAYHGASSTPVGTITDTSVLLSDAQYQILGTQGGTSTTDKVAVAWIGAGITGAQYLLIYNRIHTALVALGNSGC